MHFQKVLNGRDVSRLIGFALWPFSQKLCEVEFMQAWCVRIVCAFVEDQARK